MARDRGDVYLFRFPDDMGGVHPVIVVSRPTKRATVIAAFVTSTQQPDEPDIVPIASLDCSALLRGFVRCDQLYVLIANAPEWGKYLGRLSDDDMTKIDAGLRQALQLT